MNARLPDPARPVLDVHATRACVEQRWQHDILPALQRYIEVPAKSPLYDPDWATHGHLQTVPRQAADWVARQPVSGRTARRRRPAARPC